jgi:hypothetical protein
MQVPPDDESIAKSLRRRLLAESLGKAGFIVKKIRDGLSNQLRKILRFLQRRTAAISLRMYAKYLRKNSAE